MQGSTSRNSLATTILLPCTFIGGLVLMEVARPPKRTFYISAQLIFCLNYSIVLGIAGVVELVYALDSKSSLERGEGSSPSSGTKKKSLFGDFFICPGSNAKHCVRDLNGLSVYEHSSACR